MSKKCKVFGKVSAGLCAAILGVAPVAVNAESIYGDWEQFYTYNKAILKRPKYKKLIKLPRFRQSTNYGCGVACVNSLLRYANDDFDISPGDLEKALHSNPDTGTKWNNMVNYLNAVRLDKSKHRYFTAEKREGMTIKDLMHEIAQNHPVICAIQAWNWDPDTEDYTMDLDYTNDWESGHWAIAIGYDDDNIFFMDPSTAANYTYIPKNKLMARWHDYNVDDNNQRYDVVQCGIVVKINVAKPDCVKHAKHLYGLM